MNDYFQTHDYAYQCLEAKTQNSSPAKGLLIRDIDGSIVRLNLVDI